MTDKQTAIEMMESYRDNFGHMGDDEIEAVIVALQSNVIPVDVEGLKKPEHKGSTANLKPEALSTIWHTIGYNQAIDDMNANGYLNTPQTEDTE